MMVSFKGKIAPKLWDRQKTKLPPELWEKALMKLMVINRAYCLEDLRVPPDNRLEALKGSREGQYSIRINAQWRICFAWDGQNAHDVEIVDYH
ncbi:MAG: type II toxin-antitoxin system RelE/ParE family toxin [Desulfovibrio sp.]|uniref:type II toxin-antitoxin system RelE/ParE family toxin n=1 Tax=Desulfovibrio sp. 7SRBS1 TaxID=3378064 RepID=UPI003B412519